MHCHLRKIKIIHPEEWIIILSGHCNLTDGLWHVSFNQKGIHKINYIISRDKNKTELAQYFHGCAFSLVISIFQECIRKVNFISWPGIDDLNFKKLIKTTKATLKGHLDQERKNLQSTKSPSIGTATIKHDIQKDAFPEQLNAKSQSCFYIILDMAKEATTYTDLTGHFPYQSSRGNTYIFVAYNYDGNAILVEPMPNREADTIILCWKKCHDHLINNGVATTHYILDNECSKAFKNALKNEQVTFELVPSNQHCRNAVERAIRTFKNHLLSGLATCNPDYPLQEWDQIIPQAELTLNLLRKSRLNPKLSTWAYLFGNFDFNKSPLLPLGTKIILHTKPGKRASWDFHGEQGYYIGPAIKHY